MWRLDGVDAVRAWTTQLAVPSFPCPAVNLELQLRYPITSQTTLSSICHSQTRRSLVSNLFDSSKRLVTTMNHFPEAWGRVCLQHLSPNILC
jgi:hypothetical protein